MKTKPHSGDVASLFERASALHTQAVLSFQSSSTITSNKSEYAFLQNILRSGTLSDRLSALTLLVQSSPLHNTKALDTLKSLAEKGKGKGGRGGSLKALRCIVDWWVGGGAPDRKLKYFRDQALTNLNIDNKQLLEWYFEDWLKKYFFSVLQILETLAADALLYVRSQALSLICNLLRNKPEQEHNLLKLLVNKLGDGEKQVCSRASYHVLQVLQTHPSMQTVVIREMTSLIFTPVAVPTSASRGNNTANEHARYYAAITLNQIFLRPGDTDVALQLIDVYFRMFEDLLAEGKVAENEQDTHGKLVSAILTGVNRALPFAKLDAAEASFHKHLDTLFLITHTSTFNISLQSLVLIQCLSSTLASQPGSSSPSSRSRSIVNRYYCALYSSLHDVRLASSSKQTMYLNLLFKSLKMDSNLERVKSFIRRFIQVLASGGAGGAEFIIGGLYLLGEVFSSIPGLRAFLQVTPEAEDYDPRKRDPQFARASASPLYELLPLLHHYHPTISLHARQLLESHPITSSPDLTLNTLSHFLDRFVYKNPKKPKSKGASAMQPAASAADGVGVKRVRGEVSGGALPNAEKFWKKGVDEIPVDEVFFHKYFSRKNRKQLARRDNASEETGSELEAVSDEDDANSEQEIDEGESSDPEEDAVWKAMQATMPREKGDEIFLGDGIDHDDELLLDPDADDDLNVEGSEDPEAGPDGNEPGDDGVSLAEGSDDDDLVAMDDVPGGLIKYNGSDAETEQDDEEWGGISGGNKRKRRDERQGRRKKRKALPTFATYEEYAKMIEEGPENDI